MRLFRLIQIDTLGHADELEIYHSSEALENALRSGIYKDKSQDSLFVEEIEADPIALYVEAEETTETEEAP